MYFHESLLLHKTSIIPCTKKPLSQNPYSETQDIIILYCEFRGKSWKSSFMALVIQFTIECKKKLYVIDMPIKDPKQEYALI